MTAPEPDEAMLVNLAIGRLFRIASRPAEPGDVAEYYRCRDIVMSLMSEPAPELSIRPSPGWNFGGGTSGVIE